MGRFVLEDVAVKCLVLILAGTLFYGTVSFRKMLVSKYTVL